MAATDTAPKTLHTATYATDNRSGGYNVRVVGPYPEKFAGREVPVQTKGGSTHNEKLVRLLWTGPDKDPQTGALTGRQAALYKFEAKPREEQQEMPF